MQIALLLPSIFRGGSYISKRINVKKIIISDILSMIEFRLESGISVEDVVAVSGYSRRRLQDIFKQETGISIGEYIKARRLFKAAVRIRLCSQSLTVIAHELNFDSQQSFSREFKKKFGYTPRDYRRMRSWDLSSLQPMITLGVDILPDLEVCQLPELCINGCEFQQEIEIGVSGTKAADNSIRKKFIVDYINHTKSSIYLMSSFSGHDQKENTLLITTFIGSDNAVMEGQETRTFSGGKFARLKFIGEWDEYSEFPSKVYMNILSRNSLMRRNGVDIEVIKYCGQSEDTCQIICDYYIPVE